MTWAEARVKAKSGQHVRRDIWLADTWLIFQRGIAWFWTGAAWRVVTAEDFGLDEWQAVDWTHIPAALAACPPPPVDPDPSTPPSTPPVDPDPDEPPSGGDFGGGGGGGPVPTPPPSGPTPPKPPARPGCVAPGLSGSAWIYCPDPANPTDKRIVVGATLSGGNGLWSVKARIGARMISLGLVTAPGSANPVDVHVNCNDGASVPVYLTASGYGDCSPGVISSNISALCDCGVTGCMNPFAVNYDATATTDDGSCGTCASAGNCVVPDPDDGANCNSVGNGCCDEWCLTSGDCSPSFSNSYTSPNGVYYPSCYG